MPSSSLEHTGINALSDDDLLHVVMSMTVPDLLSFRSTSRRFCAISRVKQVWVSIAQHDIVDRNLPYAPYWKNVDDLDAAQLERVVLHVLRLGSRMDKALSPTIVKLHRNRSVTWVRLVHSEWLLAASSDDISNSLCLWSVRSLLSGQSMHPLAEVFLSAPVSNGAIEVKASSMFIALELRGSTSCVDIIKVVGVQGTPQFCRLASVPDVAHIRFIQGYVIGVSVVNNINIPSIVRWSDRKVDKLLRGPDLEGGAVAMHLSEYWLAVVRRKTLEIHLTPAYTHTGTFRHWRTLPLAHLVGSATFATEHQSTTTHSRPPYSSPLRLCISCDDGIHLYQVLCDPKESLLSLDRVWYQQPTPLPCKRHSSRLAFEARLGVTGKMVSWLYCGRSWAHSLFIFATARVPSDDQTNNGTAVEWRAEPMATQYSLGVRDFDEARGLAVFGNAFGEMFFCDFSGTRPDQLEGCLKNPVRLDPHYVGELLSTIPVLSQPAPPFPYNDSPTRPNIGPEVRAFWDSHRPKTIPAGWILPTDYSVFLFSGHICQQLEYTLYVEEGCHYYGRPVALYQHRHEDIAVVDIGGLLFVWMGEDMPRSGLMIVHPHLSLQQVLELMIDCRIHLVSAGNVEAGMVIGQTLRSSCFDGTWLWELYHTERNRWMELSQRGGRVHEELLNVQNLLNQLRNGGTPWTRSEENIA